MKAWFDKVLDFIFPYQCVTCHKLGETPWCPSCQTQVHPSLQTRHFPPHIAKATALFTYKGPLQTLFHAYKFNAIDQIGSQLAQFTLTHFPQNPVPNADLWIPVPLHPKRHQERGFDHIQTLFTPLAHAWDIPLTPLITRAIHTPFLHTLKAHQRKKAVQNAFTLPDMTQVQNKHIIIVDDILTSGATVYEIATLLHQNGAARVEVLTIAH